MTKGVGHPPKKAGGGLPRRAKFSEERKGRSKKMSKQPTTQTALTEARRETFLKVLSETGSVAAASKAASPFSNSDRGAKSTFFDERRRNPEFAAAWDEALTSALAKVETELMRRAMEPALSPITNKQGQVVGHREDRMSSDRLLLRIASRLDPDAWAERRRQDHVVSGSINHHAYALDASLVARLPKDRQLLLLGLLDELADLQQGVDPSRRIEVQDEE